MNSIGGYFELELQVNKEYHKNSLKLNTGRNALEYILLANNYKKIYLPYYSCDVLIQPIKKNKIEFEFYRINQKFEPIFDYDKLKPKEAFLFINFFGLKDLFINEKLLKYSNLILDNSQSFFSKAIKNIDSFNSARKFFGVPDGAYLFCNNKLNIDLQLHISYNKTEHLLKRIDLSPEDGFIDFKKNEKYLNDIPMLNMSKLSEKILQSINYKSIASIRRDNFFKLDNALSNLNHLKFDLTNKSVPFIYPFLSLDKTKRKKLLENKIYTAKYWPNVLNLVNKDTLEYKFSEDLICLPIDQRYSSKEMQKIINIML